ncbi:peptidase S41 [Streptomyces eurocidicus]|uniref:Carboxyl-terminal processing protease n=1 Tax=Streptomyces eurocidicus TaxID=66423 RepID=A0A2N8P3M9_STREU|nr:S41 family peptidase [Streptomyces eurocidicus]MBB5122679.1 carboxyl-terminal processing protease [Streptomyces eurocidicus]MBF6055819.1 PDZ domain-containing protein [Streptomyces eurocidicus]PNE35614.1 peptidase S41 [Streptomyces eurocidicus]
MPGPPMFVPQRRARRAAALTLVFAGVLATGAVAGSWSADAQEGRKRAQIRTFAHPAAAPGAPGERPPVDHRAVEAAAARAAQDGKSGSEAATEVVTRSGDLWSAVYSAREYEGFARSLDGGYVGVGLSARRSADGRTEVDSVRPGSPAARAGLRPGDRIRSIDGQGVDGFPVTEVVARLRGDTAGPDRWGGSGEGYAPSTAVGVPGTPVTVGLQRGPRAWDRTLRRARLATESVAVERLRDEGTGAPATRIKVESFTRGTGERVGRAVRAAGPAEGILLDLRGNSGGLVTEAVTAASAFLDGGLVATYDVRGSQRALEARPGGATRPPLVVLVDGGTMSAAELLTGALQDRGRAVVVGAPTFGKGSVQMPTRLADGSVAELTVGHYRTPGGRTVDGRGIAPDLVVRGDAERRARTVLSGLGGGS